MDLKDLSKQGKNKIKVWTVGNQEFSGRVINLTPETIVLENEVANCMGNYNIPLDKVTCISTYRKLTEMDDKNEI